MIDWGDVPTWIGAFGGVGALIGAVVAGVAAWKLLSVERARDDKQRKAQERAHVERVAAWHEPVRSNPSDSDSVPTWGVAIGNGSELPLYQVHIEFVPIDSGHGQITVIQEVVPPGRWLLSGRVLYPRPDGPILQAGSPSLPWEIYWISLRFTDAAGRTWRRDRDGVLARAP